MSFAGKTAAITGAGQGLGAGFARAFAAKGAQVALIGRTASKLDQVAAQIREGGGLCKAVVCDVSDAGQVERAFREIERELGGVDILVNNAAYHKSIPMTETSVAEWERHIQVNLNGTFYCTKAVLPGMIDRRSGKIINIGSAGAKLFFPGFAAYAASKGGIVSLTQILSEEVKDYGINVNAVYLGMTDTEHTRERMDADKAVTIPLDEMLRVEQVAEVILFLASEAADSIMGAAIDVFGKKP